VVTVVVAALCLSNECGLHCFHLDSGGDFYGSRAILYHSYSTSLHVAEIPEHEPSTTAVLLR
jgi:hypothetical protein